MPLAGFIANARDTATRFGAGALLHDAGCRLANQVASVQIVRGMAARLQDVSDASLFETRGCEAGFAAMEQIAPYAQARRHGLSMELLNEAQARGDRCYAIWQGGELAAYSWFSHRSVPVDDHFIMHFDPAWVYMYRCYTAPAYRGRRLHAKDMSQALHIFAGEGRKGLISWVPSNNFASLRSAQRMGHRIFGSAWLLRSGSLCYARTTPSWEAFGARIEPRVPLIMAPPRTPTPA